MEDKVATLRETIGNRITQARKQAGITIKELAERTGSLSAARISNWEQGTRSPGPAEAKTLSEQLNVSASYLLCLTDNLAGELVQRTQGEFRYIPMLLLNETFRVKEILATNELTNTNKTIVIDEFNLYHDKKHSLFATLVEDTSMQPQFNPGNVIIANTELIPTPGDYVLAYLVIKKQIVIRKYSEADNCLFQLLVHNELWANINVQQQKEVELLGVIVECRQYFKT